MPSGTFGELSSRLAGLIADKAWDDVNAICDERLAAAPGDAEALFIKAGAAFSRGDLAAARTLGGAAFEERPDAREIAAFLAVINALGGNLAEAGYMAKLTNALAANPVLEQALPPDLPSFSDSFLAVNDRPSYQTGCSLFAAGRWGDAEMAFRQQLVFEPSHRDSWLALATCLGMQREWQPAIDSLRSARQILPYDAHLANALALMLFRHGRYVESEACHAAAVSLAPQDSAIAALGLSNRLADPRSQPETLAAAFTAWAGRFSGIAPRSRPLPIDKPRLVLMAVVAGLANTSAAEPLADVLAKFDPRRFRLIGVGRGPLADASNAPFQAAFDDWIDLGGMDPLTLRRSMAAQRADIIIDFAGFGCSESSVALLQPLAPVQLALPSQPVDIGSGYSARLAEGEDDAVPAAHLPRLILPHGAGYLSLPRVDSPRPPAEADRICFGIDADLDELHPSTVERWATILRRVPGASLLAFDRHFTVPTNAARLLELFADHGLAGVVEVVSETDQATFLRQVDVLLQPFATPSLDTTLAALWAGTPVVVADTAPFRRSVVHFLRRLGLDGCIAANADAYVELAIAWAGDAARRQALAVDIRNRLRQSPMFDAEARARELAEALERCWAEAVGAQPACPA
jgi:predicted O-linked N-acetylglucosamine transferase (SPINDLY family)